MSFLKHARLYCNCGFVWEIFSTVTRCARDCGGKTIEACYSLGKFEKCGIVIVTEWWGWEIN